MAVFNEPTQHATVEWYTKEEYWKPVEDFYGGSIDLDPFSNRTLNVRAKKHYTVDDDGFKQPWSGNIFANPPFSKEYLTPFAEKLVSEYTSGNVNQIIVLMKASSPETGWYQLLETCNPVICNLHPRVEFILGDAATGRKLSTEEIVAMRKSTGRQLKGPNFPCHYMYFGNNPQGFCEAFDERFGSGKHRGIVKARVLPTKPTRTIQNTRR
jgi:DNA N-6-adenine-methyltransferase (Dam)